MIRNRISFFIILLLCSITFTLNGTVLSEKYDFICITSEKQLEILCFYLKKCGFFAIYTETDGLSKYSCNCVGLSVCMQEGEAYYIPFGHRGKDVKTKQLTKEQVIKHFKPILEDEKISKYMHNAPFDMCVLYNIGIDTKGLAFDSLVAARAVAAAKRIKRRNGLKNLSEEFFDETMLGFRQAVYSNGYSDFFELPLGLATDYAAADAHQTLKVTRVLKNHLKEAKIDRVYYKESLPRVIQGYNKGKSSCKISKQNSLKNSKKRKRYVLGQDSHEEGQQRKRRKLQ